MFSLLLCYLVVLCFDFVSFSFVLFLKESKSLQEVFPAFLKLVLVLNSFSSTPGVKLIPRECLSALHSETQM